jgi:hypothetical protein
MIKDKRKTLDKVLYYSYQGAKVRKAGSTSVERALINPNATKPNYDDKVISIGYEYDYKPGTVFDWVNTGTKWLIYLQDLTELAYFKGDIRKCNFEISWENKAGEIISTAAAIRGPVETKLNSVQKEGFSMDLPNHSLNILLPKTPEILKYFKRYSKFFLKNFEDGNVSVCWRVEATDEISTPGILEINALEYYSNDFEDDKENGIIGGLVVDPILPEPNDIEGEVFIKAKKTYTYKYIGSEQGQWSFDDSKYPIDYEINGNEITLKWNTTYRGQFVLRYGNTEKTIVVDSLF